MKDQIGTMYGDQAPLSDIIQGAAAQFRDYERQHLAKKTADADKKARVNASAASIMEAAAPRLHEMEEELDYWRKEAVARAWFAAGSIDAHLDKGERDDALKGFRTVLEPAIRAIDGAKAKEFHSYCVGCGKDLINGQIVVIYDDGERCHACCERPNDPREKLGLSDVPEGAVETYDDGFGPEDVDKMMEFARKVAQRIGKE